MPRPSPSEKGYVDIAGAPHYYEVVGNGYPLVLIHEGIADSRMYDPQVEAFAAEFQVIRYDVSGFGRSEIPSAPFTNHGVLLGLLQRLGVERAHLLGMSMGGGIALDLALTHPEMVSALVLAAAGVGGSTPSSEVRAKWGEIGAALERRDLDGAVELGLRMWVDGPRRRADQVDPAVRERLRRMMAANFARPEVEPRPLEPPAIERLGDIRVPTLVVVGDSDVPDIVEQADMLARGITGARKVVIPGVAHVPNLERPDDFNRLVLDFLGGVGR